jgi:hypothetical protein
MLLLLATLLQLCGGAHVCRERGEKRGELSEGLLSRAQGAGSPLARV